MTGVIATIPRTQFSNALGLPLAGGKLYTYLAGTTTPVTTYQDQDLATANENPVSLDSTGSCVIWLDPTKSYKFVLKSALGITQPGWPVDNINGASNLISLQPTLGLYAKLTALAAAVGSSLMGFIHDAANAVAQTVQDVLREQVRVTSFGAKCDGVTDDTAAIQKAVNSIGAGDPFSTTATAVELIFPSRSKCLIAGTVYIPSFVAMNLCRSALYGVGTNTMFETGYFDDSGNVVSNFGQPNDTKFVIGSRIYNGQIYNCDRAFKLLNFCEQSSIDDIRVYNVNQAIYANRCFYSRYNRLMTRAPLDGTKYPAYHFDDAVNAIEVCQLYCTQFNVGWKISGSKDNFRGINCGSEGNGVAVQIDGACNGMLFNGWYFENNSSAAFVFNSDGNHSNIDIRNCYFNTTSIAISGSTIVSGIWHRTNRVGDAILQLSTNFSNQLHVEIPTDDSASNAVAVLPSNYQLGDAVTVDYVKTIYGTDGLTAAKAKVAGGIIPLNYAGDTGKAQNGVIPFCISTITDTTLTVDSQISFRDGAPVFVQFNIIASGVQQIVGIYGAGNSLCLNKPAEIGIAASNNAGFYRFTITGLVAATDYSGVVRLLS